MRSDNELNEMIGNNVYKLRVSHNMSIKELANLIDYADSSLHLIETGARGTSACTLVKIADALGATLDQLVNKSIVRLRQNIRLSSIKYSQYAGVYPLKS